MDPVKLTQDLIRFPSITPLNNGCMDYIRHYLESLGFQCHELIYADVTNLYARYGIQEPNLCFVGHIDVVPPGNDIQWTHPPFDGIIHENTLYGRGAVDMKGAIGAFLSACSQIIREENFSGSISILLTSDEEGHAINGTKKVLLWLKEKKEIISGCIVGEPTNPHTLGEMIKIGRRGSLTTHLTLEGKQGHVAYPDLAKNPIPNLLAVLSRLNVHHFDDGTPEFDPTNLEITTIDVNNQTSNVIPQKAMATVNIRFNTLHTFDSLKDIIKGYASEQDLSYNLVFNESAEPFCTQGATELIDPLIRAIYKHTNLNPILSTTGGTSDARFIKNYCPVIEFGLINKTAHHIDEHVSCEDIKILGKIYEDFLRFYFLKN